MTNDMLKHKICGRVKGTVGSRYLLALLIDLCDEKGGFIMSARCLHNLTGLSAGTVRKNMRRLERMGYIKIISRTTCDSGCASNQYVLDLENQSNREDRYAI